MIAWTVTLGDVLTAASLAVTLGGVLLAVDRRVTRLAQMIRGLPCVRDGRAPDPGPAA